MHITCTVKNTLISQKDAVDTRTFPIKTEYPQIALHAGKKWRPTLGSPLYIYGVLTQPRLGVIDAILLAGTL